MAIKGLTTKEASFPCIGKLRKGSPKQTRQNKEGKSYEIQGKDLDHFRFDTKDSRALEDFTRAYGAEPREVNIFFPCPTADENFFTCKEEYAAGGLKHRCDGEFVSVLQVEGRSPKGDLRATYQRHFAAPMPCPGGCKEVGRLKVIIPELNRFAYVTVETHSLNDISNLYQQLTAIEMTFGNLQAVPFVLKRVPVEISTPVENSMKRARRESWLLSVEVDPEWSALRLSGMRQHAIASARALTTIAPAPQLKQIGAAPMIESADLDYEPDDFTISSNPAHYRTTALWEKIEGLFARADSAERVMTAERWAMDKVNAGKLPAIARGGIEYEVSAALDRLASAEIPTAINVSVVDEVSA